MNLSRKIILIIISTFFALILIVAAASDIILLNRFAGLERTSLQNSVQKVYNEIDECLSELDAVAKNFSGQLQRRNAAVINDLDVNSFINNRVDFIACYSSDGELIAARAADFHNRRITDLNDDLLHSARLVATHTLRLTDKSLKGYLAVGLEVSQIAIRLMDDGSILLVGRHMDAGEIARISQLTEFSIDIRPTAVKVTPADFEQACAALKSGPGFFSKVLDNSRIAGYSAFMDIYGHPVLILKLTEQRTLYEYGKTTVFYVVIILFICSAIFCAVILFFVRSSVLNRLANLSATVEEISNSKDISVRLAVNGKDELEILAESINTMLASLESAELAIRENEERYRMLFERAPDAIIIIGTEGEEFSRIVACNQAAADQHGYTVEELCSKTIFEINTDETNKVAGPIFEDIARGEWISTELWHNKKDGTQFPIEVHAGPIKIKGRSYILGFDRDITARKLAEEADNIYMDHIALLNSELNLKADELGLANTELEAFNYSVSHDMRGPITRISGYCQLILEDQTGIDPDVRTYISRIYESCCWLNEMIDAMLKLSRLTKMEYLPGQVEFSKLVEEVLQELALTEPNRCVKTVVEPDLTVTGDADLLKILMSNLIGNAWKYSARSEQACIEFGIMTSSHVPVYFVRDNGAGFDMNQVGKLFQVFTRLHDHSEFSGSGIGLVTAQRIITRHAGRIWAEGAVGCGATFYFTLAPAEKMQRSSDTENSVSISLSSRER